MVATHKAEFLKGVGEFRDGCCTVRAAMLIMMSFFLVTLMFVWICLRARVSSVKLGFVVRKRLYIMLQILPKKSFHPTVTTPSHHHILNKANLHKIIPQSSSPNHLPPPQPHQNVHSNHPHLPRRRSKLRICCPHQASGYALLRSPPRLQPRLRSRPQPDLRIKYVPPP